MSAAQGRRPKRSGRAMFYQQALKAGINNYVQVYTRPVLCAVPANVVHANCPLPRPQVLDSRQTFSLTAAQLASNIENNYSNHEPTDPDLLPLEQAGVFTTPSGPFSTAEAVHEGSNTFTLGIASPLGTY